jgi:hypothetical protein
MNCCYRRGQVRVCGGYAPPPPTWSLSPPPPARVPRILRQCVCAPGWEGHDCSLPVCWQTVANVTAELPTQLPMLLPPTLLRANGTNVGDPLGTPLPPVLPGDTFVQLRRCPNAGNCTHPNTCTCEKGWTGPNCTVPICAQECFHGGRGEGMLV